MFCFFGRAPIRNAVVLVRCELSFRSRALKDPYDAVRRGEAGRRTPPLKAVHVDRERLAVEREGDVRPLPDRDEPAVDELAARRGVEPRLDRIVVVEHAVDLALRVEADAEVRANRERVGSNRVALVCDRALDDRLRDARLLGHHPALDRELLEEVLGVLRPVLEVARNRVGVLARQVEGLTARRIVEPERIGRRLHLRNDLGRVGRHVAVGIVALVFLEAEHVR